MNLIVGLGNPGKDYRLSRHNIGFMVIDRLAQIQGVKVTKRGCFSLYGEGSFNNQKVLLAKPQTFMNRSGNAVKKLLDSFKIGLVDFVSIHDDIDLDFGRLRIVDGGGHGGHKGVLSIMETINSQDFKRVKIGIGHPRYNESIEDYVLSPFYPGECDSLSQVITRAGEAVEAIILKGPSQAMTHFNK